VVNLSATEPALDANDQGAINLALCAIKMTERDLSFSKTNVESEFVGPGVRGFLQYPLTILSAANEQMKFCEDLNFSSFATLPSSIEGNEMKIDLDPSFLSKLPPIVATNVQKIVAAAVRSECVLRQVLPKDARAPFAAIALEKLYLNRDPVELDKWSKAGFDTTALRELLQRDEALELQDTEIADTILAAGDRYVSSRGIDAPDRLLRTLDDVVPDLHTCTSTQEFQYATETPLGPIIVGGVGRNVYTNEAFLIIDLGGNDTYENSAGGASSLVGRPISIVIDMAGNDRYISGKSFSQGSGVFGIGILVDCGGDDVYEAKHFSQGAGLFGFGLLADYGGLDTFVADTFCQGAGEFGAGYLWQRGGDTTYRAAQMAQGFGGTQGVGLLLDEAGNDLYSAGGKYPCGWLSGHNFSLSQGFGYGMRPFAGGGVGILCDLHGNDHYVADVYGQGASYWYSVGLLLDAEGNDQYEAHQYCQGAGIHLSSGALVDWAGNDTFTAGHICQGAAHDYAVGMLIDRAGNDKYTGDTTAQGSAINNSFAMLLDVAGDDSYTGTDPKQSQAAGHNGDKREYVSIALMLDLAGNDTYSQAQSNNAVWLKPLYGAGLDAEIKTPAITLPVSLPASGPASTTTGRLYQIAAVDPHHPIEHLFRVALSDKPDAGKAWDEIKQLGTNALAYLVTRLDSPNVLVRAKTEELIDYLGTNSIPVLIAGIDTAKNDEVARLCCYFLARYDAKARAAIPHILPLLRRDVTRPVAFYTLGHLKAREAYAPAMAALNERELVRLRATQALGKIGDRRATEKLIETRR
jgi:hypothetical protein